MKIFLRISTSSCATGGFRFDASVSRWAAGNEGPGHPFVAAFVGPANVLHPRPRLLQTRVVSCWLLSGPSGCGRGTGCRVHSPHSTAPRTECAGQTHGCRPSRALGRNRPLALACQADRALVVEGFRPIVASCLPRGLTSSGHQESRRLPWYAQEKRAPAPFLCTYMGRAQNGRKPFRFLWNQSRALASNL